MVDRRRDRRETQVTYAGRVRAGDQMVDGARYVEVERVRRAQGRKPDRGENLHLVVDGGVLKVNSLDPVRIRARRD